ncbi:hypothetical protein D9757_003581 [Collybiopsis confluens]|uniref:Tryptophan synthase n=1 Tax=Collybiopsis confluens TaxID=2823264 RepID=A0A8H5MDC3_9AGAR|nr:hypothetical protein D9757_003581 [Collybiopsis confluens]
MGQILLARRLGKTRIIAETSAGHHGIATAAVCAKFGLGCIIYMGTKDVYRQASNVSRMKLLGAKVIPVDTGSCTLKDAISEAFRDWLANTASTYYLIGLAIGPHPFPTIVRDFQKVISQEIKEQLQVRRGKLPEAVVACVGGGSNAIGTFYNFIEDKNVRLIGVEAGGEGTDGDRHSATLSKGQPGVLHGVRTYIMQSPAGQIVKTHSISAGLNYPGVGPEHAWLKDSGRAEYTVATDEEALRGFQMLTQLEGIIPAIETSHAIWAAVQLAKTLPNDADIVVGTLSRIVYLPVCIHIALNFVFVTTRVRVSFIFVTASNMEDDNDDLGGYGTPINQPKIRASRTIGNKAGPSSKTSTSRTKRKPAETPPQGVINVDGEDDGGDDSPPPARRAQSTTRDNKQNSVKGKGKAKATSSRSNSRPMENGMDLVDDSELDAELGVENLSLQGRYEQVERRLNREVKNHEQSEQRCKDLIKQLDEIMKVRETEAEALLRAQKQQYEAQIAALERVNKELTSQLARSASLPASGTSFLLTREAADEEKRQLEQEALQWQQQFNEVQESLKEKEQREKELEFELDAQRKSYQALKSKQQGSARQPRGEILGSDHPKNLQLVRLYEDCTNLLLVGLKAQPGQYLDLEEWIVQCIFTYVSDNDSVQTKSLNFTLSCRWEKRIEDSDLPIRSKNDLQEMMYYEPLALDKEPEAYVTSLNTMATSFSFTRDQLALFLRTLYNTFDEIYNPPNELDEEMRSVE